MGRRTRKKLIAAIKSKSADAALSALKATTEIAAGDPRAALETATWGAAAFVLGIFRDVGRRDIDLWYEHVVSSIPEDPVGARAKLVEQMSSESGQRTVAASVRVLLDTLDPAAIPSLGLLAGAYLNADLPPDSFFRRLTDLLLEADRGVISQLIEIGSLSRDVDKPLGRWRISCGPSYPLPQQKFTLHISQTAGGTDSIFTFRKDSSDCRRALVLLAQHRLASLASENETIDVLMEDEWLAKLSRIIRQGDEFAGG